MREQCHSFAEKLTGLFSDIIFKTMTAQVLRDLDDLDITLPQLQALTLLAERGKCSVGELAERLQVTHPAAVKLVNRLEEKAFVTRTPSPADQRQSDLRVTGAGLQIVNTIRQERIHRVAHVLDQMEGEERRALIRGLEAFVTTALSDDGALDQICWSCQTLLPRDCEDFPSELTTLTTHS